MTETEYEKAMAADPRQIPENWGKCLYFDVKPWISVIDQLASSDDVLKALQVCDLLPAYQRIHEPEEITEIRSKILAKTMTPHGYAGNANDMRINEESVNIYKTTLRAILIKADVEEYNKQGKTPHIVEVGPGEYTLPLLLKQEGLKFTYKDIGLHNGAAAVARDLLKGYMWDIYPKDQPVIFVACEIIEHLHFESDLYIEFMKHCNGRADKIHMSTPNMTFDGHYEDAKVWERRGDLGHLRTYCLHEFAQVVQKMFRQFNWKFYESMILHATGEPKNDLERKNGFLESR